MASRQETAYTALHSVASWCANAWVVFVVVDVYVVYCHDDRIGDMCTYMCFCFCGFIAVL